jgi:6-phosphofructokinase 1
MWIVREGYEGLVRGNAGAEDSEVHKEPLPPGEGVKIKQPEFVNKLRFGDGALLRDGTGDYPGRRSLKGRHIVRVGFDDVRGWMAEVRVGSGEKRAFWLICVCREGRSSGPRAQSRSARPRAASPRRRT